MLIDQEIPNTRTTFRENREIIQRFFESKPLKNSINEFYQVQKVFHQNMTLVVYVFSALSAELSLENKLLMNDLLKPYLILSINIFNEPTGNLEDDLNHILKTINLQNTEFKKILIAVLSCITNLETFNNLLVIFKQDKTLANRIKQKFNCQSWLDIEGYVNNPFQNLMRYEILLKAIQKSLIDSGCEPTHQLLENLSQAIAYLVPQISTINDSMETIALLQKIEQVLLDLLVNEIFTTELSNQEKPMTLNLKEQIEFVLSSIKTGKAQVIQDDQNICSLYQGLLDLLKIVEETYIAYDKALKSTFNKAYTYSSNVINDVLTLPNTLMTFFGVNSAQKNEQASSLKKLQDIIQELSETIEQTKALKNVHAQLKKKS